MRCRVIFFCISNQFIGYVYVKCCFRQDKYENLMKDYEELKREKMEMDEYHCLELETNKEGMERVEQVTVQLLSNCRMAVIVMSNKISNKIHISILNYL